MKLARIKAHLFSGPLLRIMNANAGDISKIQPLQIEVRFGEWIWIVPKADGSFLCGFSNTVSDKSDLPIAKVLYNVFI